MERDLLIFTVGFLVGATFAYGYHWLDSLTGYTDKVLKGGFYELKRTGRAQKRVV